MKQKEKKPREKNYKSLLVVSKIIQPALNILFYVAIFFIVLALILTVIILLVNEEVEQMLLPPFMSKIMNDAGEVTSYGISFGNGIKIITEAGNVALGDVKAVIYAWIFVIVCTLMTLAPVFKFASLLLKNISSGEPDKILSEKNPRYVMFIGICISVGSILIRFMMRFYNYYLAARFIKGAPQEIRLSLGIDIFNGMSGLVILFMGLIFAYVLHYIRNNGNNMNNGFNGFNQ